MDALIAMLLSWLASNSQYETGAIPHPRVIEFSPEELTQEYYINSPQMLPADGVDDRIMALYSWNDGDQGTIYILGSDYTEIPLSQETGWENPLFQERLLHELVHHVQYYTGEYETFDCTKQGEFAAYTYGGQFLKQQSVADPLPNRHVLAHLYSRC